LGSLYLTPLYKFIHWSSHYLRKPLAIILLTLLSSLCAIVVFYNIPAFIILGKIFPSKLLRALLFLYLETTLFSIGCRAFGRFNNKTLIALWKSNQLVPIFPGDK